MSTEILERVTTSIVVNPDDPIKTHVVNCPADKSSTEAWLTEASVFGLMVKALCGYEWIPTRDPKKHPVCQACLDIAQQIIREEYL